MLPPADGELVLLDPRSEDPLHYLLLDLTETFLFQPKPGITDREKARALYTIHTIGLNTRDHLVNGRRSAFAAYRDIFAQYVLRKQEQAAPLDLAHRIAAIKGLPHKTVWEEMKRWHQREWLAKVPGLVPVHTLFEAEQDALHW